MQRVTYSTTVLPKLSCPGLLSLPLKASLLPMLRFSLEICESALAELAEREARIRKERTARYKYPKKPRG
jgi:hypothetical protein